MTRFFYKITSTNKLTSQNFPNLSDQSFVIDIWCPRPTKTNLRRLLIWSNWCNQVFFSKGWRQICSLGPQSSRGLIGQFYAWERVKKRKLQTGALNSQSSFDFIDFISTILFLFSGPEGQTSAGKSFYSNTSSLSLYLFKVPLWSNFYLFVFLGVSHRILCKEVFSVLFSFVSSFFHYFLLFVFRSRERNNQWWAVHFSFSKMKFPLFFLFRLFN